MKIVLGPEAVEAIQSLTARMKGVSPYVNPSGSAVACQAIIDYVGSMNVETVSRLAERLLSPAQKRKALLMRLAALAQSNEAAALQVLEKSVRKLDRSNAIASKNEPEK